MSRLDAERARADDGRFWRLVDIRTGRMSHHAFFTRDQAEARLTQWRAREEAGGRPDLAAGFWKHYRAIHEKARP